jgi:hypothetical protein
VVPKPTTQEARAPAGPRNASAAPLAPLGSESPSSGRAVRIDRPGERWSRTLTSEHWEGSTIRRPFETAPCATVLCRHRRPTRFEREEMDRSFAHLYGNNVRSFCFFCRVLIPSPLEPPKRGVLVFSPNDATSLNHFQGIRWMMPE